MYVNKCVKCGREFETKNPKRVICPNCLYPDKKMIVSSTPDAGENPSAAPSSDVQQNAGENPQPTQGAGPEEKPQFYSSYSSGGNDRPARPPRPYNNNQGGGYNRDNRGGGYGNRPQGGYNRDNQGGGYNRPQGGYNRDGQSGGYNRDNQGGGYNRPQGGYNQGGQSGGYNRPQGGYNQGGQGGGYNRPQGQGGYNRDGQSGGYNRPQGGYNQGGQSGGYRPQGGYNRDNQGGGYNRDNNQGGGYNRGGGFGNRPPQQGGFRPQGGYGNRPQGGGFQGGNRFNNNRRPMNGPRGPKQLLISKEQLEQIELLYRAMLPLPNPDCHEVIGEKISLEPRKVFFGVNLVRQKMMLPKLPFPKRKLAISPDQLFAIKNLYEPLLPLPPIGCHKILASQLKMDEWRVHVGIGLVRSQMGLERWNQERDDAPAEFKKAKGETVEEVAVVAAAEVQEVSETAEATVAVEAPVEVEKPKRGRKPKKVEEAPES